MIMVVDTRRSATLGVDVNLQLESYLENAQRLVSHVCILGRSGAIDTPWGLIVSAPQSSPWRRKTVHVACRGRAVCVSDASCVQLVDVDGNPEEGAFGWTFLLEAALTATRIRDAARKMVIITTDLVLAVDDLERSASQFFSEISRTLDAEGCEMRVSLVFVELAGSRCESSGIPGVADRFASWESFQRLRDTIRVETFALDLIGNTPAMFESQLRCWLRASCPRQPCVLRMPATETFSGVCIEMDILPYVLDLHGLLENSFSGPIVHAGFSDASVLQGIRLDTLDQGLCRGDPLLCIPSQCRGSLQHGQANRKLFAAVCLELNDRDMGLLIGLLNPVTLLQERWVLMPQAPVESTGVAEASGGLRGDGGTDSSWMGRALIVRLATREDVLEDASATTAGVDTSCSVNVAECYVERAAASASIDLLDHGTYNPLGHPSGLLERLTSPEMQGTLTVAAMSNSIAAYPSGNGASGHQLSRRRPTTVSKASSGEKRAWNRRPIEHGAHHLPKKREVSLRYADRNASGVARGDGPRLQGGVGAKTSGGRKRNALGASDKVAADQRQGSRDRREKIGSAGIDGDMAL